MTTLKLFSGVSVNFMWSCRTSADCTEGLITLGGLSPKPSVTALHVNSRPTSDPSPLLRPLSILPAEETPQDFLQYIFCL